MSKLTVILLDAKKACGAAVVGAGACLAAGFIDNATAGVITGGAAVVTTVVVYWLGNVDKDDPPNGGHVPVSVDPTP